MSGNPGRVSLAIAVALSLMLLLAPAGASAASPEERMLDAIDEMRRGHGLPAWRDSGDLNDSARRYSEQMLARDYFGHLARIRTSGHWAWRGENLAMYYTWGIRVGSIVRGWMNSPAHRHVLLSSRFRYAGVGFARGRMGGRLATTVTLHTGRP